MRRCLRMMVLVPLTLAVGINRAVRWWTARQPQPRPSRFVLVELVGGPLDGRTVELLDPIPDVFQLPNRFTLDKGEADWFSYAMETDPETDIEQRAVFEP